MCVREREREGGDRQTDRRRDRRIDRQTGRQTNRQTGKEGGWEGMAERTWTVNARGSRRTIVVKRGSLLHENLLKICYQLNES